MRVKKLIKPLSSLYASPVFDFDKAGSRLRSGLGYDKSMPPEVMFQPAE
jgi:hypothetical protein